MATITFNGESHVVDHAVKGADYVHGYDANGVMVCCITGIANFDAIGFDGTYMSPSACLEEPCNDVAYVNGALKTKAGGSVSIDTASKTRIISSNHTLELSDAGKLIVVNSANAVTITIPAYDSVAFPVNTEIEVCRWDVGAVTFAAGSGVGIGAIGNARSISDAYGCVALKHFSKNLWILSGALS